MLGGDSTGLEKCQDNEWSCSQNEQARPQRNLLFNVRDGGRHRVGEA
jgi:hypothetical protein